VHPVAVGFTDASRGRLPVTRARATAAACALAALAGGGRAARGDGAFPDSLSILVPADRPHHIALATNFGLISTDDDGAHWTWVCEGPITNCSMLYSQSAPPGDRVYALSADSLVYSDDDACTWSIAAGAVTGGGVVDAFPFRQDAARMLAVVSPNGVGAQTTYTVVASHDGGATFGDVLYTAASGDVVTGVEAAETDAQTIFLTLASAQGFAPLLAITTDGGAHWRIVDLSPELQQAGIRLVGVDRTNPSRVFLRVSAIDDEALAIYDASRDALTTALTYPGGLMTAFVQTAQGPLIAAGSVTGGAVLHRSFDDGQTWQEVEGAPHLRALAERGGRVFGAADDMADGYALGVSSDQGQTFTPLMKFADVGAIAPCVRASCQDICKSEVGLGLWPASTCTAAPEKEPPAASHGCAVAGARAPASSAGLLALVVLGVAAARRRRGA
jgi:MYXO-CTERM domain-containing protein